MNNKKLFIGLMAIAGLVGCKDAKTYYDTDLSEAVQQRRETQTQATMYNYGNIVGEDTLSSNIVSILLASEDVQINYDVMYFDGFDGTGYAFNMVLNCDTNSEPLLQAGTYKPDSDQEYAALTYDVNNTYLTMLHGGNTTKVLFESATINVLQEGGLYTINLQATTLTGAQVTGSYTGAIIAQEANAFNEPIKTSEWNLIGKDVFYEPGVTNYSDWALDSMFSYYGEEKYKAIYTPINAHYFMLTSQNGDALTLEVDLNRFDKEFTEFIPNGQYDCTFGCSPMNSVKDIWTTNWEPTGSYFVTNDGVIYYITKGEVTVELTDGEVTSLSMSGSTANGSLISANYAAEED